MKKGISGMGAILLIGLAVGGVLLVGPNLFLIGTGGQCEFDSDCQSGKCEVVATVTEDPICYTNTKYFSVDCPSDAEHCTWRNACGESGFLSGGQSSSPSSCGQIPNSFCDDRRNNWELIITRDQRECVGGYCGDGIIQENLGEVCDGNAIIDTASCNPSDSPNCLGEKDVRQVCTSECKFGSTEDISSCRKLDPCCGVSCEPVTIDCHDFCSGNKKCEYAKDTVTASPQCKDGACVAPNVDCGQADCEVVLGECSAVCDGSNPCSETEKVCEPFCQGFEFCIYDNNKGKCTPKCSGGVCGTCTPDCGTYTCSKVVGECNFGNVYVSANNPYSVSENVIVNVNVPESGGFVYGTITDSDGNAFLTRNCYLMAGECELNFGTMDFGDYNLMVSKGGVSAGTDINVWRQVVVKTFGETEQGGEVEIFFEVRDDANNLLEDFEIDDIDITVEDGGVIKTLGNQNFKYVGVGGFYPGNIRVNYVPMSYGTITFTGTFGKDDYFDGVAVMDVNVKTSKMSLESDIQSAVLGETKTIRWRIDDTGEPVQVESIVVEVVDSTGRIRKTANLNEVRTSIPGEYGVSVTFDKPEKWSVNIFAEKTGYSPLNDKIAVSVADDDGPTKTFDWIFLVLGIGAAILVIVTLIKIIRRR